MTQQYVSSAWVDSQYLKVNPIVQSFVEYNSPEIQSHIDNVYVTGTMIEVLNIITESELFPSIKSYKLISEGLYTYQYKENLFVISVLTTEKPFSQISRRCEVILIGREAIISKLHEKISDLSRNTSRIHWYYLNSKKELQKSVFRLKYDNIIHPSFYPWFDGVDEYIDRFENSSANILILIGDPGTGKTSFIRHLLSRAKQDCFTTYDSEVMGSDQIYIDFIAEPSRYLVLEDSDLLLTSRLQKNNNVMSRILNASDGLIPLKEKKFIFTANVNDVANFDEALVRPGRCFDVVRFRLLKYKEAVEAAKAVDLELTEERDYSLAEIFNGKQKAYFKNKFSM